MVLRRTQLLSAAILALAFAWPLEVLLFRRAGYVFFALFLLAHLAIGFNKPPRAIAAYLIVIGSAFVAQSFLMPLQWAEAFLAMSAYFAVPLLAGMVRLDYDRLLRILGVFKFVAVVYFSGLLLQFAGVENAVMVASQTETFGEVHQRYTSISGNPLLLGMYSFFAVLVCLAEYPQARRRAKWLLLAVISMALVCLYFSYARRYYVLTLLAIGAFLWMRKVRRTYFTYAGYAFIALLVLAILVADLHIYDRLASMVDFDSDAGNVGRLILWLRSIDLINENPLLGMGVGFEGTIGKTEEETLERVDDGAIAEMYYLKVALEFGMIVGAFFALWMLSLIRRSLKDDHFLYHTTPILTAVECVMGGALASPFFAFPFWLIVAQMRRHKITATQTPLFAMRRRRIPHRTIDQQRDSL